MKRIIANNGFTTFLDDEDYNKLSRYTWHLMKTKFNKVYFRRWDCTVEPKKVVFLHREILNAPDDLQVDHIDNNTLNNTRENLRLATRQQNCQNRKPKVTKYKGVSFNKANGKYHVQMTDTLTGNRLHLGDYETPEQAAKVYDTHAIRFHKGFARLNFPLDKE